MADIVIRNGSIVDGTLAPAFTGDREPPNPFLPIFPGPAGALDLFLSAMCLRAVAMKDGVITEIGPNLAVKGAREIDATDKVRPRSCSPFLLPLCERTRLNRWVDTPRTAVGRRPVLR